MMRRTTLALILIAGTADAQTDVDCLMVRTQMTSPIRWLFSDWRDLAAICGLERPSKRRSAGTVIDSGPTVTRVSAPGKRIGQQATKPGRRVGQNR